MPSWTTTFPRDPLNPPEPPAGESGPGTGPSDGAGGPADRGPSRAPGAGRAELQPRRARTTDARAFAALSRLEIERGLPPSWTPRRLARLLARDDANAYALVDARGGIGGFSIASFGASTAHLVLHAVTPGLRRTGFGRLLLDWQVRAGLVAGVESMDLEVRAGNTAAIAFYRSSGFAPGERIRGYYDGREDALRMRLAPLLRVGADDAPHGPRAPGRDGA